MSDERDPRAHEDDPGPTVPNLGSDPSHPTMPITGAGEPVETELGTQARSDVQETIATPAPTVAHEPETSTQQVIAGRYTVVQKLGEGGMGRVYRVRDQEIQGREVALKVLRARYSRHRAFRQLFFTEVKTAQEFVHEHVNQVRDTGQDPVTGELYMTMDLVEGESLRDRLRRENNLVTRHALEITRQVLLGLQAGHEKGLIHRDVKPENVMLAARVPKTEDNPYGVGVRLLDFGLAGVAAEVEDGQIAGTPTYMSPEQAQGQRLDARSDLFAVGIVLYEMIAGTRPFHGKSVDNILTSVLETDVAPLIEKLEHLSTPVQHILKKALEKKRDKRFQSAAEFLAAIEKSPAYRVPRVASRFAGGLALVLAFTTTITAVLWWSENGLAKDLQQDLRRRDATIDDQAADIRKLQGQVSEAQAGIGTTRGEMQAQLDAAQARIAERDGRITELTKDLAAAQSANVATDAAEDDRFGKLETDLKLVEGRVERLQGELATERDAKTKLEGEIQSLEAELRKFGNLTDPAYVGCRKLDEIVTRLELGKGTLARRAFDALMEESVIQTKGLSGSDFLDALTMTASGLERFRGGEDEVRRTAGLLTAERGLALSLESWYTFRELSREWIDQEQDGNTAESRLAALEALVARYQDEVTTARSQAVDTNQQAWDALIAEARERPDRCDPAAALELASLFDDDRFGALTEAYARFLAERCLADGGLDVQQTTRARYLTDWGALLADDDRLLELPGASRILSLDYAGRWYDADDTNDELDLVLLPTEPVTATEPIDDWLAELRLKARLAASGSGYQGGQGSRFLYRTVTPDGRVGWHIEKVTAGPRPAVPGEHTWDVETVFYDAEGGRNAAQTRTRVQYGKTFADDVLRAEPFLRAGEPGDRVVAWKARQAEGLPNRLPIKIDDVVAFQAELAGRGPVECVAASPHGVERWFSPELGMVYERIPGRIERELVYAQLVR